MPAGQEEGEHGAPSPAPNSSALGQERGSDLAGERPGPSGRRVPPSLLLALWQALSVLTFMGPSLPCAALRGVAWTRACAGSEQGGAAGSDSRGESCASG